MVLYHNKYGSTSGWIHTSVPFLRRYGTESGLTQRSLFESLQLHRRTKRLCSLQRHSFKTYFIRPLQELKDRGLFFDLSAYAHQVYMDFHVVSGSDFAAIYHELGARGVDNFDGVRREMQLRPIIEPLRQVLERERLANLIASNLSAESSDWTEAAELLKRIRSAASNMHSTSMKPRNSTFLPEQKPS
ncbi:MAG: hypothetical protein MZV64_16485 [Ignavibacteriales bacterium]|nr:hypothetical protein [Ignavibacteriales bacterium]